MYKHTTGDPAREHTNQQETQKLHIDQLTGIKDSQLLYNIKLN